MTRHPAGTPTAGSALVRTSGASTSTVGVLVVADAISNTRVRHPLATALTVAALNSHAMLPGDHFAWHAARLIALDPPVQRYALYANAPPEPGDRPHPDLVAQGGAATAAGLPPAGTALLVHGQFDHLGDIALSTRAWAQREPLADYVVIPAAGHASNLDNRAAFTAALLDFLDRVLPPQQEETPRPTGAQPGGAGPVGRPRAGRTGIRRRPRPAFRVIRTG